MIKSSIGKKAVVGATGVLLFLFVLVHMIGNLQLFAGREAINNYGEMLHYSHELLWLIRAVLLTSLVLHIVFTVWVTVENRKARPVMYAANVSHVRANWFSRTMIWSGLLVFAFIVYHLLHFTAQVTDTSFRQMVEIKHNGRGTGRVIYVDETINSRGHPTYKDQDGRVYDKTDLRPDVYGMLVKGFESIPVAFAYLIAQVLLACHLSHGVQSFFKTLGLYNSLYGKWIEKSGPILAAVICIGFISLPIAIQLHRWTGMFGLEALPTPALNVSFPYPTFSGEGGEGGIIGD